MRAFFEIMFDLIMKRRSWLPTEMSTLCDYNSTYKNVEDMYPFPI